LQIGIQVRKYRKLKKWTLAELGERAGLRDTTLCEIESGRHNPSIKSLGRIAEALGVDVDYLFKKE